MCSPVPSGQVLPRQAPFSDGKRRMLHTKGWKWSVVLLLAALLAAGLLARGDWKLGEDALHELVLAEPEPIEEEGLIFTNKVEREGETTYSVVCFHPDTLEETVISTFTFDSAEVSDRGYYFCGAGMTREAFSSDYSRMAVTKCYAGTTKRHAGWIDTAGNFFDVTKALGRKAEGHYGGPAEFYALGFAGCWFGYYQHIPDSAAYMDFYVPVDMVKRGAVQGSTFRFFTSPDGEDGNPVSETSGEAYAPWNVTVWLQDMRRTITGDPNAFPDDWDLVRSPDGTKMAYMSLPKPEGGSEPDLYITSTDGEPVKVTGYSFSLGENGFVLIDWR